MANLLRKKLALNRKQNRMGKTDLKKFRYTLSKMNKSSSN